MLKKIPCIDIKGNEILGDLSIDFFNKETNEPYKIIAFVGENGCGKTTLLNCLTKIDGYHYVFMRQNSMFIGLSNESYKLMTGKELYPIQNRDDLVGGQNVFQLRINSTANNKTACIELLKSLNDDELIRIYESNELDNSRCGGEATRVIDGKTDGFDMNTLSSGQQEILLKLKTLRQAQIATDIVLLDEPETSLHPRWQKKIVGLIRDIVSDKEGNVPQLFLATHSEKVLESLINNKDALIVRLFKENGKICYKTINQMSLCLPKTTFAELDYVIFKIDTYEYCSQLYDLLEWRYGNPYKVDKTLLKSSFYDEKIHYKPWYNDKTRKTEQFALPTYVRNYFHHPKDRKEPTQDELHTAIDFLRNVILHSK